MNGIIRSVVSLLFSSAAFAQGGATGAISDSVVDMGGGAVTGADVQIIDTATEQLSRRITTGADGAFLVTLLPPGRYSVVVNKTGFAEAKAPVIEVRVTETTRWKARAISA